MGILDFSECCIQPLLIIGFGTIGILVFLKKWISGATYDGIETMVGKTVVITGANTGIGKETVKDLAMRGARVIMGCRDTAKGDKACQEIIALTNNKNIENRKLDLASFASIRAFAKTVLETEPRIDVLINNAGVSMCPRTLTEDGLEMQMGTNHFGHFLLTNLLLDRLKQSAPSRIVILSSMAHQWGTINFDDLHSEKSYFSFGVYANSKLANILHMHELSRRLQGTRVTVNSVHPGSVDTEVQRHVELFKYLFPIRSMLKTPKRGAQTTLRLAIDPKLENVTATYFSDCKPKQTASQANDEATSKRLWEISENVTKKSE